MITEKQTKLSLQPPVRPIYLMRIMIHKMALKSSCRLLLVLPLLLLTSFGCQPMATSGLQATGMMAEPARESIHTARLSLFLNLSKFDVSGIRLEIANLEILVDGAWLPVAAGSRELDSKKIADTQLFLGGRAVPPGICQGLRFTVTKGSVLRDTGKYESVSLEPFAVNLELPSPLSLAPNDSRSLFLAWDVQDTLDREGLRPVMTIAPQIKQILADLVYAACPDIDTIFVIRSDKNWVADSFGVKGRPTYLAMDPDPDRRRLFVLARGESAIKVVELSSQRVIDSFHLSLTDIPDFMTISSDGRWAYVLEERGGYLSRIDLISGGIAARVRIGQRPQYASYLAEQQLLAVSSTLSQKVLLLHPLELSEVRTILVGNAPQGLVVAGNQLYVAETGEHTVSVFDLATNRSRIRLDVGFGPRRLLDTGSSIYVSNYESGSLSVLLPEMPGVVREVHGLGRPLEMIFDQDRRLIYVGEEQAAGLAVIDSVSNELVGRIPLGARPSGLAILQ